MRRGPSTIDQIDTDERRQLPRPPAGRHVSLPGVDRRSAARGDRCAMARSRRRRSVRDHGRRRDRRARPDARRPRRSSVAAVDELGRHAPVKIQLLGHDRSDQPGVGTDRRPRLPVLARARRARPRRPRSTAPTATSRTRGGRRTAGVEAQVRPGHVRPRGLARPGVRGHDARRSRSAPGEFATAAAPARSARSTTTAGSPATSTSTRAVDGLRLADRRSA